jgi:hypothetical protein
VLSTSDTRPKGMPVRSACACSTVRPNSFISAAVGGR